MKIKIKWIIVVLRFVKVHVLSKHCLFVKPFLTLLMSRKTGRVENNNINYDSIENNSYGYGSLEINIEENKNYTSIEASCNEELLGEDDEDKNQVDKCNIKICKKGDSLETGNVEDKIDKGNIEICKITVSSETLPLCENILHTSDVASGLVEVKVPVVLRECSIDINVQSSLKLKDAVLEIKQIKKNVYLNQCTLIPNSENGKANTGILFIDGFIRSNIEYFTKEYNDKDVLRGKLKYSTVNAPFKCTTRVTFNTAPKFKTTTSQGEVEFFNEKVFCELISAEFAESYILENPTNKKCKSPLKQTFHNITEKVALSLTIKLLQNQNVII